MASVLDKQGYGRQSPRRGYIPQVGGVRRTNYSALENYKAQRHARQQQQRQFEENEKNRRNRYMMGLNTAGTMPPKLQRKYNEMRDSLFQNASELSETELMQQIGELNALNQAGMSIMEADNELRKGEYKGKVYRTENYDARFEDDGADFDWREEVIGLRDGMRENSSYVPDTVGAAKDIQGFIDSYLDNNKDFKRDADGNIIADEVARGLLEYKETGVMPDKVKEAVLGKFWSAKPEAMRYYTMKNGGDADAGFSDFVGTVAPMLSTRSSESRLQRYTPETIKTPSKEFKPSYSRGGGESSDHTYSVTSQTIERDTDTKLSPLEVKGSSTPRYKKENVTINTVKITPKEGKKLTTSQVQNDKGDFIETTIVGVEDDNKDLKIIGTRKLTKEESALDLFNQAIKVDSTIKDLPTSDKNDAISELVTSGKIVPKTSITERFDYEQNKNLINPSKKEIYKMTGNIRAYETPEDVKEAGYGYMDTSDKGDPMSIDDLYFLYKSQVTKDYGSFGEFLANIESKGGKLQKGEIRIGSKNETDSNNNKKGFVGVPEGGF